MNVGPLALTIALALIPAAGLAQTTDVPAQTAPAGAPHIPRPSETVADPRMGALDGFPNQISRGLTSRSEIRANRAQRAADLINVGKCAEAETLARRENDRELARRITEVCEADS